MATRPVTKAQATAAIDAVNLCGGNLTAAAKQLGIPRSTLYSRVASAKQAYNIEPSADEPLQGVDGDSFRMPALPSTLQSGWEIEHQPKQLRIWSLGDEVRTVDEAIAKAEIDLSKWSIKSAKVKQYVVPMKVNQGQKVVTLEDGEGKTKVKRQTLATQAEERHREVVWLIEVIVQPRAQKWLLDALDEIHERAKKHAPKYKLDPLPKGPRDLMYEISLFDHHFGKLCWAVETGQNYDLKIAEVVFYNAVMDLLARAGDRNIDRFLFPIGQDLLHIDNVSATTTSGTALGGSTDGRYAKIVDIAFTSLVRVVDDLTKRAPVDIVYVPGNHDKHVSYHLARELDAWYRHNKRVTVDSVFRKRKYYRYGTTLLGLGHADTEKSKWSTLPNLMATEKPHDWAATTHHEWHVGHLHTKQKREMLPVEEVDGVIVRVLASLSGLDNWHYESGYFSKRAAEAYLWSKTEGYVGHFSVNARE